MISGNYVFSEKGIKQALRKVYLASNPEKYSFTSVSIQTDINEISKL